MRKALIVLTILALPAAATLVLYFALKEKVLPPTSRSAVGRVEIYAGAGQPGSEDGPARSATFADPFGVAVDDKGNVLVADGGRGNRIRRITPAGQVETVAGGDEGYADGAAGQARFNTPSGLAVTRGGDLIIADTANHRVRKLDARGNVSTVAGTGVPGFKDGAAGEAQFDGPIGVAADRDGNLYVADAYNDRIRKISVAGEVSTVAGTGLPGYADGPAEAAQFDTPCGVTVDAQGNLYVADTGNDCVRKITPQGEVTTVAGRGEDDETALRRPVGIVVTHDGFLFVTEEGRGRVRRITREGEISDYAGEGLPARLNHPSGLALDDRGSLYVADTRNYLVRRVTPVEPGPNQAAPASPPGLFIQPSTEPPDAASGVVFPQLRAEMFHAGGNFPWPLAPQDRPHEITGVMGEARGTFGGVALHHIHSGLDVRGLLGEATLAVLDDKTSSPLPNWGFESSGEGLQLGLMSYIHVRVGRNQHNEIQAPEKFKPRFDPAGQLIGVRVRRGARFRVGDFVGTLNRLYHVHLNFGPWGGEVNPLQFPFVGFRDTVPPVVEPNGIEVTDAAGVAFERQPDGRLVVAGDVRVIMTAYDQADGNARQRKLGLYRAGYQLLREGGTPVRGFESPLINIVFDRLPPDDAAVFKLYAEGSGVSAYGTPTKFKYIVTNRVRDGQAREGLLRLSGLPAGNYRLRVMAEDYAGNRATGPLTDLPLYVEGGR